MLSSAPAAKVHTADRFHNYPKSVISPLRYIRCEALLKYSTKFHVFCILLIALLFSTACASGAATNFSDLRRSSGSKYKATATVIIDDVAAGSDEELASMASASSTNAAGLQTVGRATVLRGATGELETFIAGENITVEVGDIITAWEGKTVITFFNGHTTRLTPVSKIQIASISESDGVDIISLYQELGSSANHVNQSEAGEVEFDISTDSSIAAVRGTDFNVQICGPEQTFYQTFTGIVEVTKEEDSVLVNAGEQLLATLGNEMDVRPLPVAPSCGDSRVVLDYPLDGEFVFTSTVPIFGTVTHENFDYWKIEYKPAADPSDNYSFLHRSETPINNDQLTTVDVSHLGNGDYTFRLMVVDKTGNYPEPCTANVYLYPNHAAAAPGQP